jgi:hypothetical protein
MKKTRLTLLLLALTAAAWSLPGLAQAKAPCHATSQVSSAFDGGGHSSSAFDGGSAFDGH